MLDTIGAIYTSSLCDAEIIARVLTAIASNLIEPPRVSGAAA
jgi:hypothetical protein